jgi:hypothetical protein
LIVIMLVFVQGAASALFMPASSAIMPATAIPLVTFFALPPIAIGLRFPVPAVAAFAAVGGAGLVIFSSLFETTVQRLIPEAVLSRVLAYDWFGSLIAFPIGLAIAAPLATGVGLRLALVGGGILEIVSVLGILAVRSVWNLESLDARSPTSGGDLV